MIFMQGTLISENLRNFLSDVISVVPKLIGAIVFIFIGWLIARIVKKVIIKLLKAIKIDRLSEAINRIDIIQKSSFEFHISTWLTAIVYYFIMLIIVIGATDILGIPTLSNLLQDILTWIPNLVTAMAILAVGLLFAEFIRGIVYTATHSMGIPSARIISLFLFYFILITVIVSAMSQAKIETVFISSNLSILIGGVVAAFALAYGLAAKEVIANFLASQYSGDKIKVGDLIVFDGHEGSIIKIDKSAVVMRTETEEIIVPLHLFLKKKIQIKK